MARFLHFVYFLFWIFFFFLKLLCNTQLVRGSSQANHVSNRGSEIRLGLTWLARLMTVVTTAVLGACRASRLVGLDSRKLGGAWGWGRVTPQISSIFAFLDRLASNLLNHGIWFVILSMETLDPKLGCRLHFKAHGRLFRSFKPCVAMRAWSDGERRTWVLPILKWGTDICDQFSKKERFEMWSLWVFF